MPLQNKINKTLRVVAPGKLILIGEYAVLHGAKSLVTGIDVYANARISDSKKTYSTFQAENISQDVLKFQLNRNQFEIIETESANSFPFINELLKQFCRYPLPAETAFDFQVATSEFYSSDGRKFGLGSSAAATVAAAYALNRYLDLNLSREAIFKLVFAAHQAAQNNIGSGVDIAASVYGGILVYCMDNKDQKPLSAQLPPDLQWMPIWTGKSASTKDLVRKLNSWSEKNEYEYNQLIHAMKRVSESGCEYFCKRDVKAFCKTISDYTNLLDEMTKISKVPILSEEHLQIRNLVYEAGGVYKPSGAGFGDLGIAFYDEGATGKRIDSLLSNTFYQKMNFSIDYDGVNLIKN